MEQIYLYRHQVAGIITTHAFKAMPTASQISPIRAECERLHGKTGWEMIVMVDLFDKEIPVFPDRSGDGSKKNIASVGDVSVSGTLTVTEG